MEEKKSNHMCSLNEAKAMKNQSEEEKGRCRGSEAKVHECVKGKITENNLEKKESLVASQHDSLGFSSIYTCFRSPSSQCCDRFRGVRLGVEGGEVKNDFCFFR